MVQGVVEQCRRPRPETKNLAPVAIHLHSVVAHSIYRTYCKIGDQDLIQKDEFQWMIVLSFQRCAKTELTQVRLKDNANKHIPRNSGNRCAPGPDEHYDTMKAMWHTPPHIVVAENTVTFGDMWPRPLGTKTLMASYKYF
ncbi:hypothetical protein BGZ82_002184 [Podila clonocystis]|nr:hypothetical protein BGZ82_002184 [Podila clonocystis]